MRMFFVIGALLLTGGCGRYFPGPLTPVPEQTSGMSVNDDGSIAFARERLEVVLQPLTDAQLNRQFGSESVGGAESTNPYTFGDWQPLGAGYTPQRFTVFLLTVRNYQYPKVLLDPVKARITTSNKRDYGALTFAQLDEYYRAYWQGRTGQGRVLFEGRTDLLRRTMFKPDPIFSGQESSGYVVFPRLHDDVTHITVTVPEVAVRFNFAGQPVEVLTVEYTFARDVIRGFQPPPQLAGER